MTLYVDSSALLKRYFDEPDADVAEELLSSDDELVTARITIVEVRRNLARHLDGRSLAEARQSLDDDLEAVSIVEVDRTTCELAAVVAEQTGTRSLDAIHLGAIQRLGGAPVTLLTFDRRQAQAARTLGFGVVGA